MTEAGGRPNRPRPGLRESLLEAARPPSLRGAVAVLAGAFVLLLPELSVTLVEIAVGVALAVSSITDLGYAAAGRGRRTGSRPLALVRGSGSLLVVGLVLLVPRPTLHLLVGLLALYLGLRGLLLIIAALLQRPRPGRGVQIAGGVTAVAFGALTYASPSTTANGLVLGGALAAIVVGSIMLAYGLRVVEGRDPAFDPAVASLSEILWDWVRTVDVGAERREDLAEGLYFEHPGRPGKLVAWSIMLVLSVAIATYAVLQDSTAVVIGAMLIAPLMVPILALAGALVNGWRRRAAASLVLVLAGVVAAVALSYGLSAWAGAVVAFDTNSQITSRVDPTMLDMLIAIAAGAAGAFATINKRVAPSIAGVAIAVALVPPLSVVGISLGAGRIEDALGASLLFTTNFVAIVLSAAAVFVLGGFAEPGGLSRRPRAMAVTMAPFAALAALILVPLVFTSQGLLATSTQQRQAQTVVEEWLGDDTLLRLDRVSVNGDRIEIEVTGPDDVPPLDPLQAALADELGRPVGVAVTLAPVTTTELAVPSSP